MNEILTQAEIDALFEAFREPIQSEDEESGLPNRSRDDVSQCRKECDLGDIDSSIVVQLSEPQLAALKTLNSSFAWAAEAQLSELMRNSVRMKLAWQAEMTYEEYLHRCDSSIIASISSPPLKGRILLEMGYSTAHSVIDAILGRIAGKSTRPELNEVERALVEEMIQRVLLGLTESWRPVAKIRPALKQFESSAKHSPIALMSDPVLVAELELIVTGSKRSMSLCIPNQVLKPFLASLASKSAHKPKLEVQDGFLDLQTGTSVRLTVDLDSLKGNNIGPGSLVELAPEIIADLTVKGRNVGSAELVRVGDRIAVRIVEITAKTRSKLSIRRAA